MSQWNYRVLVHYHVKPGMENHIMTITENELLKTAQEQGFHQAEFWQDEMSPSHFILSGTWETLEAAQNFRSIWESKRPELMKHCSNEPYREIYRVAKCYPEKSKKAA